jgi:C-terminal domain 7 of the ABC-three component (ABC-3C) systems
MTQGRPHSPGDHHAAGPALGYVFQFEYAMLLLLPRALADEDAAVSVEVYDDVAFHRAAGPPKEVVQVHHSVNSTRDLLDTSHKTWRTLAIWAGEYTALEADEAREMTLLTTQRARAGSALEALTTRARNLDHAMETLVAIAEDPAGAEGTAADRATFDALGSDTQRALLSRITVVDGAPPAVAVRTQVERLLKGSHESRFVPSLADSVEGWWWPRVVRALHDSQPIHAAEMRAVVDEGRRALSNRALPIRALSAFDDDDLPVVEHDSAAFVACLRAIDASDALVGQAVDDFLQASAHRSYWMRRLLIGPEELGRYDGALLTEWDMRCDRTLEALREQSDAAARKKAGRDLYHELQLDVHAPLRPEVPDRFVQRGSFGTPTPYSRSAMHFAWAVSRDALGPPSGRRALAAQPRVP